MNGKVKIAFDLQQKLVVIPLVFADPRIFKFVIRGSLSQAQIDHIMFYFYYVDNNGLISPTEKENYLEMQRYVNGEESNRTDIFNFNNINYN